MWGHYMLDDAEVGILICNEHTSMVRHVPSLQRDRRHRDAPGGTRNIQKLYRWEAGQRVTKFRALLPLTANMEPYILGDFREMQVRKQFLNNIASHSGSHCRAAVTQCLKRLAMP